MGGRQAPARAGREAAWPNTRWRSGPAGRSPRTPACPSSGTSARQRGHGLADVARWMAAGPAAVAGLPRKGAISPGYDAGLVAFDDTAT